MGSVNTWAASLARRIILTLENRCTHPQPAGLLVREGWVANNYHNEEGRGDYYHNVAGTSEAQCLLAQGLGLWHQLGLTSKLRHIVWRRCKALLTADEWGPHWAFAAKGEAELEAPLNIADVYASGAWDYPATFVNGVAQVTFSEPVRRVMRVVSDDAVFEWRTYDAPLVTGQDLEIQSADFSADHLSLTLTLSTSYTGGALLVLAYYGQTVPVGTWLHYYPIRRGLLDDEVVIAADSLGWFYDAAVANGERALGYRVVSKSLVSYQRQFSGVLLGTPEDPLPGFMVEADAHTQTQQYPPTFELNRATPDYLGVTFIKQMGAVGQLSLGVRVETDGLPVLILQPHPEVWQWYYTFIGSGEQSYVLSPADFRFYGGHADWRWFYGHGTYGGPQTEVQVETGNLGHEPAVRFICSVFGDYGGVVLYKAPRTSFVAELEVYYTAPQSTLLRFRDTDGWNWLLTLPPQSVPTRYRLDLTEAVLDDYQTLTGPPPSTYDFSFDEIQIVFTEPAEITLNYVGEPSEPLGADRALYGLKVGAFNGTQAEVSLSFAHWSAGPAVYAPWRTYLPFTIEKRYGQMMQWLSPIYVVYQQPWLQQLIPQTRSQVEAVLTLIEAAQMDYAQRTGVWGPVSPVWHAPASEWPGVDNTFYWNGPDPNTHWGGFQYRVFEHVARLHCKYPQPISERILERYLGLISGGLPTEFREDEPPTAGSADPYATALALQGLIYCRLAGLEAPYLRREASRLQRWVVNYGFDGSLTYGYWHGQILIALALAQMYFSADSRLESLFLDF